MYDLSSVTSDVIVKAPRIILLGGPKIGKSTFAAGSKNPIFLPVKREEGVDALTCAKCPVSNTYEDVIGWLGSIYGGDHSYETVVIDSASTLEPLIDGSSARKTSTITMSNIRSRITVVKVVAKGMPSFLLME